MFSQINEWLDRENGFAAFVTGPLTDFWRTREECEFTGVDGVRVSYVRFCSTENERVIVVCPGRIECYVKYAELAYDLFNSGYDVLIIDHRGQGRSERLLSDSHRGHVVNFSDYVDDFDRFYQHEVQPGKWKERYLLAHSMGGAIAALWLEKYPDAFNAVALCAPMFGITLRWPEWIVRNILNWAESHPRLREGYAPGTGRWRALPFSMNVVTHSQERYRRNLRFYADDPELRVGGPTFHWVRESIIAGEQILAGAAAITTPIFLLQAGEERVVDNRVHHQFCQIKAMAGHPSG